MKMYSVLVHMYMYTNRYHSSQEVRNKNTCRITTLPTRDGDYENMSQRLLSVQVSRLLRLLATLHMYVNFIQQSN